MNTITLTDGKKFYFETQGGIKGQHVVGFIAGLGDGPDDTWIGNSLRGQHIPLTMLGVSLVLPALFYWEEGARSLFDSTLEGQTSDIREFVGYLREQGAASVHLGAHSLAALVAMAAADPEQVDSLMLYDPSHTPTGVMRDLEYVPSLQAYIRKHGAGAFYSKRFVDSVRQANSVEMAGNVRVPTLIVNGGKGTLWPGGKEYKQILARNGVPVEHHVIPGAKHYFSAPEHISQLLLHTTEWLAKQIRR